MALDVPPHFLVPPHSKLSEAEKKQLLERYKVEVKDLPKILRSDPALVKISCKPGDIIKIDRSSKTAGTSAYYRVVVHG